MSLDLLIPFGILCVLVVYLIFTRNSFEKDVLSVYDKKFEEWKKHSSAAPKEDDPKELVGLVFKKNYKYEIEVFNKSEIDTLNVKKLSIKEIS